MLRIGICGGTFDPFHNGHLALISAAVDSGRIDRLLVIPAGDPPHKQKDVVMPAVYRYEMARKSLRDLSCVEVSDLEIMKKGRSYTLDSIRMVRSLYEEEVEICLIYGSDIIYDLDKWYKPEEILSEAVMILAVRGGDDEKKVEDLAVAMSRKYNTKIELFPAPRIDLSSTIIRQNILLENDWEKDVPGAAAAVIKKNGFYSFTETLERLDYKQRNLIANMERKIWSLLTKKRLLHSVNVMLYALELAHLHEIDLIQAATAGLLHDCAKCMTQDQQIRYAQLRGDKQLLLPELAHGPAGAVVASNKFAIEDKDILRAIHYHTTGRAGMSALEKIIFLADKIELGRTYQDLEPIRAAARYDLDKAMLICLTEVESFLRRSGRASHPYALAAIEEMKHKSDKK